MGDTENPHEVMEDSGPPVQARLVITLLANGMVHVDFPQAGVIAFGMLHEAERIITKHFDAASAPMIQAPNGALRTQPIRTEFPGPFRPRG